MYFGFLFSLNLTLSAVSDGEMPCGQSYSGYKDKTESECAAQRETQTSERQTGPLVSDTAGQV